MTKGGKMETDKIYLGDAYELIKEVPDKSVDLIITDPPYSITAGGSGGCFGSKHRTYIKEYKNLGEESHAEKGLIVSKTGDNCTCVGFDLSILEEFERVQKKTNIYIWCSKDQVSELMEFYEKIGRNVDLLVWGKKNPIPTCNNKYLSDLEYVVFAHEKGVAIFGNYKTKSKFYISETNKDDKSDFKHPTIKPLPFIKNMVENSSERGG